MSNMCFASVNMFTFTLYGRKRIYFSKVSPYNRLENSGILKLNICILKPTTFHNLLPSLFQATIFSNAILNHISFVI